MAVKGKITDPGGFAALIESIKSARKTSDAAASGVSGMEADFQGFVENLNKVLKQVNECLVAFDANKANIAVRKAFTIPPSLWEESDDQDVMGYPYKCILSVPDSGIDSESRVDIVLDPDSSEMAGVCGMCPTTDTETDAVIIWCREKPEDTFTGQLYITQGTENPPGESDQEESEGQETE